MEKLSELSLGLSAGLVFASVAGGLFLYISFWFVVAACKKRADLSDVAWGPGFMWVAWTSLFLSQITFYGLIINILVTIWAMRLAFYIYLRNRVRDEDFRYRALKKGWKQVYLNLFFKVFFLQGCILYVVALPIIWIHTHAEAVNIHILWALLPLWFVGFAVEAIADNQMARFKKEPSNRDKLLTVGLWGVVRHPNYLGELLQWWTIWLMAAPIGLGWIFFVSPLLLTFLIVKVSGIKPLEEKQQMHADFKAYAEKTPALIPYFW